ncbi:MAG TPA: GFA family protein, partial [Ilumatobacteraceae bacterium]|nr:GFA family protein [Ilumatobacteraceae bacterium]
QLAVTGELRTFEDRGEHGDAVYVYRRFCPDCGSPIVSELVSPPGVVAVKAGTLDDRSEIVPAAEIWCETRQPWAQLPGMPVSLVRE